MMSFYPFIINSLHVSRFPIIHIRYHICGWRRQRFAMRAVTRRSARTNPK